MAAWAQGDVLQAYQTFTEAVASLHAAGNLVDELGSHVVLADLCRAAGRPVRARELCERALKQAESLGDPLARAAAELHVALAELDVEVGRLDAARDHLEAASARADRAPVTESHFRLFVAKALVAAASGEHAAATGHLDRAEELHRPGFFPDVRPIPALRARLQLARGDLVAAGHWARESEVSPTDPPVFLREYDHLTLVRLLLARHRAHLDTDAPLQAIGLLERLRDAATASGRAGSLVEVRLLTALAHHALGQTTEALRAFTDALTLAPEPEGYVRVFLDEGAPAVELLHAAADAANGRAARVLAAAATAGPPGIRPLPDPLSERELQVLRLLDTELSGPEIARELFISPNTLRTHTKHVFTKLGVTSRRAAVARARERGLLGPDRG
jgi:LuxR family maltose regulon positive regulatory protein